jgi:RNA polymerase sigma-70 factor (ECF subfamily)
MREKGGTGTILSLEELNPEVQYAREVVDNDSPDAAFERRWAGTVLRQALDRLREEQVAAGKEGLFDCLADINGAPESATGTRLKLGLTEAVKMTIHRLHQHGELLRLEVARPW